MVTKSRILILNFGTALSDYKEVLNSFLRLCPTQYLNFFSSKDGDTLGSILTCNLWLQFLRHYLARVRELGGLRSQLVQYLMVTAVTSPLKSNYPTFASPQIKDEGTIAVAIARRVGAKEEMEYIFCCDDRIYVLLFFQALPWQKVLIYSRICNKMV